MTSNYEQELHEDYVDFTSTLLKEKGFNRIKSRLIGKLQPPQINGFWPDIYAEKVKKDSFGLPVVKETLVVAVETKATQVDTETRRKHRIFKKWAKEHQANFKTILAR
jgi:hypothetical protein